MRKGFIIMVMAACICCAAALPAGAANFKAGAVDLTVGGSVKLNAGWTFSDYGDVPDGAADDKIAFEMELPDDANINLNAASGQMSAYAELGLDEGEPDFRHLYATYDMGGGNSLLLGKTWTCFAEDSPAQKLKNNNTLNGFGDMYAGLNPQIRFGHTRENLTFQAAIEDNKSTGAYEEALEDLGNPYLVEDLTPALVLSLGIDAGQLTITPSLYMQQFTLKANMAGLDDIDLTSYALAVNGSLKAGDITLSGEIWMGQNTALFSDVAALDRAELEGFFGAPAIDFAGSDVDDVSSMGFWGQIALPIKPGTLCAGFGYQQADVENEGPAYESEVETMGFFVNFEYPLAKNFSLTPELCYYDYGNAPLKNNDGNGGNDLGSDIIIGVHFKYDF